MALLVPPNRTDETERLGPCVLISGTIVSFRRTLVKVGASEALGFLVGGLRVGPREARESSVMRSALPPTPPGRCGNRPLRTGPQGRASDSL